MDQALSSPDPHVPLPLLESLVLEANCVRCLILSHYLGGAVVLILTSIIAIILLIRHVFRSFLTSNNSYMVFLLLATSFYSNVLNGCTRVLHIKVILRLCWIYCGVLKFLFLCKVNV